MKVKEVTYAMTRVVRPYENDKVSVTIEIGKEGAAPALKAAKALCERALALMAGPALRSFVPRVRRLRSIMCRDGRGTCAESRQRAQHGGRGLALSLLSPLAHF